MQLVIALLLSTLTFLAGIDRTEVSVSLRGGVGRGGGECERGGGDECLPLQWVCATLGVAEVLLVLVCLSWLLSEAVLLVCLLLHSTLKRTFLVYFAIIGWG